MKIANQGGFRPQYGGVGLSNLAQQASDPLTFATSVLTL